MDKVVLFDNKQGEYGVYDTVSEIVFDRLGREIYGIEDILYKYNYLEWNKAYKDMCIEWCKATGMTVQRIEYKQRDVIVAFNIECDKYYIMIEFV